MQRTTRPKATKYVTYPRARVRMSECGPLTERRRIWIGGQGVGNANSRARIPSRAGGTLRAAARWLWPCLLTATPFHLGEGNPALSSVPTLAAAGLLAGILIDRLVSPSWKPAATRRMTVAGATAIALLSLPEWATLPAIPQQLANKGVFGTGQFIDFSGALRILQPILLFGAAVVYGLMQRRFVADNTCGSLSKGHAPNPVQSALLRRACAYAAAASVGYLIRYAEAAWYGTSSLPVVSDSARTTACQLLLLASSLACTALADRASGAGEGGPQVIAHLSLGTLLWGMMTRVLNPHGSDVVLYDALCALSLVCIVVFFASLLRGAVRSRGDLCSDANADAGTPTHGKNASNDQLSRLPYAQRHPAMAASLERRGLAPREMEVAIAYVLGEPVASIAETLGIKPGSVRATAQRVYGKMGVSSKSELIDAVKAADSAAPLGENTMFGETTRNPEGEEHVNGTASRQIEKPGIAVCALVTLIVGAVLPLGGDYPRQWGIARALIYGMAMGFMADAVLGWWGMSLSKPPRPTCKGGRLLRLATQSSPTVHLTLLVIGCWLLLEAAKLGLRIEAAGRSATFVLALLGSLGLCAAFKLLAIKARGATSSTTDGFLAPLMTTVALGLGFAWEELWRLSGWYTLFPVLSPMLCVISLGYVALLLGREHRIEAAAIAVISVAAFFAEANNVLFAAALLSCAGATRLCIAKGYLGLGDLGGMHLACGTGMVAGDYLVNYAGTLLAGNAAYSAPFGGREALSMLVACLAVAFAIICSAACLLASWRVIQNDEAARTVTHAQGFRQRAEHVLFARGLNRTQVEVAMDVIDGKSSAYIAEMRHISRGAVNSARTAVYRSLGVHSRPDFIAALAATAGL